MKKWIVGLVLVLGGIMMFFSLNNVGQREELDRKIQADQQLQLETSIAKWLVSDYEGVEEIEFTGWRKSVETGMWRTTVRVNGTNKMSITFDDLSGLGSISGGYSRPDTFKLVEKDFLKDKEPVRYRLTDIDKISLDGVKVIHYSDKEK